MILRVNYLFTLKVIILIERSNTINLLEYSTELLECLDCNDRCKYTVIISYKKNNIADSHD